MIEIPFRGDTPVVQEGISIGQETDNNARSIRFTGLPVYSEAQRVYLFLSFKDKWADTVLLEDGVFTVGALHTQYPGRVKAYIEITTDEGVRFHSKPFYLVVGSLPAIGEQIVMNSPSIMQQVTEQVDKALSAAKSVQSSPWTCWSPPSSSTSAPSMPRWAAWTTSPLQAASARIPSPSAAWSAKSSAASA